MAPAPTPFFAAALLLLVLLYSCSSSRVYGDDLHGFGVVRAEDFMHGSVCSESKVSGGHSLKVVHRYGPCSPSGNELPDDEQILGQDSQRAAYLQNQLNVASAVGSKRMDALQASLETTIPVHSGSTINSTGTYVVTIGLGTPTRTQTVQIDTGSNLCWVQCSPCQSCYQQRDPIFDPATSTSYRNVTYGAPPCTRLPPGTRFSSANTCVYRFRYADSSSTMGFLATETLRLGQTGIAVENFVFGCGHTNVGQGLNGIAGIFGLGRTFHSLVSQTSSRLGSTFYYCLPTMTSGVGYLTFGRRMARSAIYTPMQTSAQRNDMYFIELLGISVGRQRLPLSPTVFGSVGTIIDSGTLITRLPPVAYRELRTAFRNRMAGYRQTPPFGLLETCYAITMQEFMSPPITLHFRGADISLKPTQVFFVPMPSLYCLAFAAAASGELGVIGSIQQRGTEVIYDISNSRIGFLPQSHC